MRGRGERLLLAAIDEKLVLFWHTRTPAWYPGQNTSRCDEEQHFVCDQLVSTVADSEGRHVVQVQPRILRLR